MKGKKMGVETRFKVESSLARETKGLGGRGEGRGQKGEVKELWGKQTGRREIELGVRG